MRLLIDTVDGYLMPMASLGVITLVVGFAAVYSAAADQRATVLTD